MTDFTIITPVLNQVSHIETCILSVLEQDCQVQFIIMDGGSTDGTVDIIRKYEKHVSIWKSEPDEGQSDAINKGLQFADGSFFNWLNADDRLMPNALDTVKACATTGTDIVVGKCEHVTETGESVVIGSAQIWDSLEATLGNYSMGQPSVFYRTSVVKELGQLNSRLHYCMDMDLWFRYLIRFGQENIRQTDAILSRFLIHSSSKSVDLQQEMRHEKYGIYKALLSQFAQPKVLQEFFDGFSMPDIDPRSYHGNLQKDELLANFCWHLLADSYQHGDLRQCKAYFEIVSKGTRLSETERLKWKARLATKRLLG